MLNYIVPMPQSTPSEGAAPAIRHIAVVGNALPRRCGLATFTSHVVDALAEHAPHLIVDHYAMDDGSGVAYPNFVRTVRADDLSAYQEAARLIEASGAEAIWLQHEFGIFGGDAGGYLLALLDGTSLPVVTTLHTVLETFPPVERFVFDRLLQRSSQLIVMAEWGRRTLHECYGVDEDRIEVIPHGVPDRPYVDPEVAKARFDLAGREIVMTFGLLSPGKGISDMIEALPAIVSRHPDVCYVVIGATHPNLIRDKGEAYRDSLRALAAQRGVESNLRFIDAFLDQEELLDWIEVADVYVTPYLNLAQITSGTLAYAVALGKPVVSTPYVHAAELLVDGHGIIVPPADAGALASAINGLLADEPARLGLARRVYRRGREHVWAKAVERALAKLDQAHLQRRGEPPVR